MLRGLLLTGSVFAVGMTNGGAALACNPSIVLSGPGSFGGVSNNGDIDCVAVTDHAVVNGNITNEPGGTISATGSTPQDGIGISVQDATVNGAIVNNGVISATGAAISVTGKSAVTGGIRNDGEATVNAGTDAGNARGIAVTGASMTGGITNSGTIIVTSAKGRAVGIGVGGSSSSGGRPQEPQQ